MLSINISEVSEMIEHTNGISSAGAAPEDRTGIPTFQVKLESAAHMNERKQRRIESIVKNNSSTVDNVELIVESSKDMIEQEDDYFLWIWVYGKMESISLGGETYHVIAYNQDGVQVRYHPSSGDSPVSPDSRWISWSEIELDKDKFLS